jgi:hypothetical protein
MPVMAQRIEPAHTRLPKAQPVEPWKLGMQSSRWMAQARSVEERKHFAAVAVWTSDTTARRSVLERRHCVAVAV